MASVERRLDSFLGLRREEATLKFFFENIRNYLTIAALATAGTQVWRHGVDPDSAFQPYQLLLGFGMVVLAFCLFVLNITQMLIALAHRLAKWSYFLATLLLFPIFLAFVMNVVDASTMSAGRQYSHQPVRSKN